MKTLLLLLSILFVSCSTTPEAQPELAPWTMVRTKAERAMFVGRFYAKLVNPQGQLYDSLIDRKENGEYVLTLKTQISPDKKKIEIYRGFWGVGGHFYFTTARYKMINGSYVALPAKEQPFDRIYSINKVTPEAIELYNDLEVMTFVSSRVDNKFTLP